MKYFVTHRFHLSECLRAGTPLPVMVERTVELEAESIEHLSLLCCDFLGRMVKRGGIVGDNPLVAKQKGTLVLPNVTKELTNFDLGIFIPGHMVAYVETITTIKPRQDGADEDDTEVPIQ